MSKKTLKTASVLSELTEHSVFFKRDAHQAPHKKELPHESELSVARTPAHLIDRSGDRSEPFTPKKVKRVIRRYSFEAYDDHVRELKHISLQAGIEGENVSISGMIREAIETFLKKHRSEITPTDRSSD